MQLCCHATAELNKLDSGTHYLPLTYHFQAMPSRENLEKHYGPILHLNLIQTIPAHFTTTAHAPNAAATVQQLISLKYCNLHI